MHCRAESVVALTGKERRDGGARRQNRSISRQQRSNERTGKEPVRCWQGRNKESAGAGKARLQLSLQGALPWGKHACPGTASICLCVRACGQQRRSLPAALLEGPARGGGSLCGHQRTGAKGRKEENTADRRMHKATAATAAAASQGCESRELKTTNLAVAEDGEGQGEGITGS